jgi:WD40 repeat protein
MEDGLGKWSVAPQAARVNAMAFSPDGKILVSTFGDTLSLYRHNDLQIWDVATQQPVGSPLKGHESDITRIAFGKSGSRFASASDDGTVRLWDAATGLSLGEPLRGHEYTVEDIVFSPDGITLASAGDNNVLLWDVDKSDNLTSQADNPPNQGEVRSVAFSFDGKMLASGAEDGLILWDVRGHHVRKPVHPASKEVSGEVTCVTFSPSGHLLGSSNSQGMVQLLDTTTVDPLGTPFAGGCVSFSPDGKLIASTTDERTVTLRDQSTHQPFGKPLTMQRAVTHLAFNPSGTVLATASFEDPPAGGGLWSGNGIIRLWNVMTQKEMGQPLRGHGDVVNFVTFSHDGKLLASASDDGTVRLWDAATGLSLGEPLRGHRNGVTSAAFSPDGKTLASASADATVRLWDLLTRQPLGDPIRISNFAVNAVAFSPDGNLLASAGADDDGVWLWDVNPTSWASRACIRANRNLTLQEWRVYIGGDRPYHKTCPNLPYPETTMDY